ncbi:dynein axonemal assembly factor 5-like [Octopus vulgaris]|uniref:Dynein axonemal assembly factor 5-like n=1 Tax=Octopus vulgaris TaxID=6645 RepID=A0AA36BT05_OCTVU|nr:dynein axonemal assembly factor 5-like [Octopus vulgaris]
MAVVEESLPNLARNINFLNESNKMIRRKALQDISKDINKRKPDLESSDLQRIFNELLKPLLKEFSDPAESCREQAIELMSELLTIVPGQCEYLPYLIPVLVQRLGQQEIIENSEEVRLILVRLLIKAMELNGKKIEAYLNDVIKILQRTIVDNYPQIKKNSCMAASLLAKTVPDVFHMQSESLINPLLQNLTHQHSKVRVCVLEAIGDVIQNGNGKSVDDVRSHLAQRLFDQVPAVRAAVTNVVGNWLLYLLDRYSYHHKLIPLLLTSINDSQPSIQESALAFWHDIAERPNLGCRVLVNRHLSKILPALVNDLKDWVPATRVQASSLLCVLLLNAERSITQHLQILLSGMFTACKDEEKQVVSNMLKSAKLVGYFVQIETWSHLLLDHICKNPDAASLMILAAIIEGCDRSELHGHLEAICNTLILPDVSYHLQVNVLVELYHCVQSVLSVAKEDCSAVSFQLFTVLITILSLNPTENSQLTEQCQNCLQELADVQELPGASKQLFKEHSPLLLVKLKETHKEWTSQSFERSIFETLLMKANESALPLLTDEITEILSECLDVEKNPEFRLKMMTLLSCAIIEHKPSTEVPHPFSSNALQMVQKMIVPNLIWKAGRIAAAIRTSATSAVWALLQSKAVSNEELISVSSELLPQILSSMEDDNRSTRLISCRVLTRLLETMAACQQIDYDTLHKIYPHLLKRLDDASDDIRVVVATTFLAYFDAFSDDYDTDFYKAHLEVMYQGLLLHLDDSEKSIQDAILNVLKKAGHLKPAMENTAVENECCMSDYNLD